MIESIRYFNCIPVWLGIMGLALSKIISSLYFVFGLFIKILNIKLAKVK
jgi:hypothetical protein